MTSVRRALAFSMAERYVLIGIALIGNMLLARLLTPEEIGIYSVSLAIIGIAQVLRDFGIGTFLIQKKDLSEGHIRTAFGISLVIGSLLFLVVFFGAPWAAKFYGEGRMAETMRISSLNFLVLPFCSISLSLLRRDMLFKRLAVVTLAAAGIGFATTISLAFLGFGPNSMAIGAVASAVATGMGAWLARTDRKLLLPGFSEWRALLNWGGQSAVTSVVTTISMDINDLVLGKVLGFGPVAMISRAQGLMNLFHRDIMGAIRNVAYPAFSRAHRDGAPVEPRYIDSVVMVTAFAWPFYGFTAMYSHELIRLMFGPQWDEAATLVPIFCLAGAFAATSNLLFSALLAVGRIDVVTKTELLLQPFRVLLIVVAAVVFESLVACAVAFLISAAIAVPIQYAAKQTCMPTDFKALLRGLMKSGKLSLVTLAIPALFAFFLERPSDLVAIAFVLFLAGTSAAIGWILGVTVFNHPIKNERLYRVLAGKLISRREL